MSGPLSNPYMFKSSAVSNFYTHQIPNSVRMSAQSSTSSSNGRLTQTFSTVDSNVHFTLNFWIKRSAIGGTNPVTSDRPLTWFTPRNSTSGSVLMEFKFSSPTAGGTAGDSLMLVNTNSNAIVLSTDNLFRDTSAWYNIHIQGDLDNGTASEKLKFFINGTEASYNTDNRSSFTSFPGLTAGAWTIGDYYNYGYPIQCYFAQWAYVDGSTLAPTVFAEEKNGVWIPKDLSSGITWGSAGHLLMFQDSSALGDDTSGEGNDWSSSNLDSGDQMLDSPTFGSSNGGNYCMLNPLFPDPTIARINDCNLAWGGAAGGGSVNEMGCMSTFAIPPSDTNKYYFEARMKTGHSGGIEQSVGVNVPTVDLTSDRGGRPTAWCITNSDNQRIYDGANSYTNTSVAGSAGDIVGVEIDRANTTIKFYVNGTLRGTQTNLNTTTDLYPWVGTGGSTSDALGWDMNFGQNGNFNGLVATAQGESDATGYGNFYYDEAGSCKALCAGNLPIVAEIDPAQSDDDYPQKLFGTLQYTGNGSERTIDTTFQVDKSWARSTIQGQNWYVLDTNRGYFGASSNNLYWKLNDKGAQATFPQYNFKAQSGSDITITDGTWLNSGGHTQQMWNWRLAGGTTSTNTQGDVNSTVQVDPSGCFSIATYRGGLTGAGSVNVGHGLSKAPSFIIFKGYDNLAGGDGQNWIGSDGLTSWNYFIAIDSNSAQVDKSGNGSMSAPTSTVFSVNNTDGLGSGTIDNIAYSFADCEGYIKSGKYIGNANADGTFIYLGFKPAFFWILHAASGDDPQVWDTSNGSYNPMTKTLSTHNNSAQVDNTNRSVDFLSNGVKIRSSNSNVNSSNAAGIIYLAMAHNPFKYSTAR